MKSYLGVDGGATKTEAVLIDKDRKVIGKGRAGGSLTSVFGLEESSNQIYKAVKNALDGKRLKSIPTLLALAGVDRKGDNSLWKQVIKNHPELSQIMKDPVIVNDTVAALRAGTEEKNALVIIAGTGSNCYGRNGAGEEARSGGAGHLLGDEGSAFYIGSRILHSVVKSLDGRGPKTILADLVFSEYKINSLDSLISLVYVKPWNKTDIAKVAPFVEIAAEQGDESAKEIIENAADELSDMIKAVAKKLHLEEKAFTVVTSGSVFKIQKLLHERMENNVLSSFPLVKFTMPKMSAAEGAAHLVLESYQN